MTQFELKTLLHYSPETGDLTWLVSDSNRVKIGDIAGNTRPNGYILIRVKGRSYRSHRLAFLYMTGKIPEQVDHINHQRSDNRWENLRPATRSINLKNQSMRSTNTSGFCGVSWNKAAKKWVAKIQVNSKNIYLGIFTNLDDAIQARKAANLKHNFHQNHGK